MMIGFLLFVGLVLVVLFAPAFVSLWIDGPKEEDIGDLT